MHRNPNTQQQPILMTSHAFERGFPLRGPPLREPTHYIHHPRFSEACVMASKEGWLLMMKYREPRSLLYRHYFFDKEIMLGNFDPGGCPRAVFSAPPTSADCVIFVVRSSYVANGSVTFYLYRHGDPEWTCEPYECTVPEDVNFLESLAYSSTDSKLYCVFAKIVQEGERAMVKEEVMGILDTKSNKKKWRTFDMLLPQPTGSVMVFGNGGITSVPITPLNWSELHLTDCGGEFVLICKCVGRSKFCIFKLDKRRMDWTETKSLENKAIFLSNERLNSSFAILTKTERLRNKIFYFGNSCIWIYDMEDGRHKLSGLHPYSPTIVDIDCW